MNRRSQLGPLYIYIYIYIYLCNNQHKSDVVEIEKGQINDVLLQSGLLITQPLWEAH